MHPKECVKTQRQPGAACIVLDYWLARACRSGGALLVGLRNSGQEDGAVETASTSSGSDREVLPGLFRSPAVAVDFRD